MYHGVCFVINFYPEVYQAPIKHPQDAAYKTPSLCIYDIISSIHTYILEPQRPTVFSFQPTLTISEATSDTAGALGVVGAVEEGYVLVTDVLEPVYLALVFEQAQRDAVDWRIAPTLVEEAASTV